MGRGWSGVALSRRLLSWQASKGFCSVQSESASLPLHDAIKSGDDRAVTRSLLDGADINARDDKGWTALQLSLIHRRLETAQHLIDSGADLSVKCKRGFSLRELALFANMTDTADQLPKLNTDSTSNFFTDSDIQRMSAHRKDSSFMRKISTSVDAQYIIMQNKEVLVKQQTRRLVEIILANYELIKPYSHNPTVFLGQKDDKYLFAINMEEENIRKIQQGALQDTILLPAFPGALSLTQEDAALYGHAMGMLSWQQNHKYCSLCGHKTSITDSGYKAACSNEHCSSHKGALSASYPRLDPTVICSVVSESHILLARQPRFPRGMYSCIAGYVEPAESVEGCCQREVKEEVGIEITDVRYVGSQFWPMPPSLMIGCLATADRNAPLEVDNDELEEARWFSREEVVLMMLGRHTDRMFMPPQQAIAHQLIKHWLINSAKKACNK